MKHVKHIIGGLTLLTAASSAQAGFLFDPDGALGPAGTFNIDTFDVAPTSVLGKGANQAIANFINGSGPTTFDIYTQGKITGLLNSSNTNVLPSGFTGELTVVMGFKEQVTGAFVAPGALGFASFTPAAGPSFVEIYYDTAANSDRFAGTGYGADATATKIFSSIITGSVSNANTYTTDLSKAPSSLDQNGNDANADGNNNDWNKARPGSTDQLSVTGGGNQSQLIIDESMPPAFVDTNFFKNLTEIVSAFFVDINLNTPYIGANSNDPMRQFITTAGAALPGYTVWDGVAGSGTTLGAVNGGLTCDAFGRNCVASGPDFLFSTDANINLSAKTVPEPSTIAILGLGIMAMGFSRRKNAAN